MVLGIFKIALRLRDRHVTICESFKRFQYFNVETNFLENENLFQKIWVLFFSWNHKIENTSCPFKTVLSEANLKTNRMVTTKWTYHKEWSFATSLFGKSVSVLEPLTDFIGCTNASNTHICILCKCCYTSAILRYLYLNNIFVFSATPCWFAFWVFVLRFSESGLITSMRVDGRKHIPSDFAHVVFRT